ncbi:MAG: YifB family Mg chelatase-like AAA ATPase [Bacillota bacterium]|nr:YifB family Mg chelatase-like AAA ATPase [Bacillota bacterium]
MLAKINAVSLLGMETFPVMVEADVSNGLPAFDIVGLPDAAVRESKERVKAAIKNAGFHFPSRRIVVNLAPADLRKDGTLFDLPIAIALLIATEQLTLPEAYADSFFFGELSLDGSVSPVNGVLPLVSGIAKKSNRAAFVPYENRKEAALDGRVTIYPVKDLKSLALFFQEKSGITPEVSTDETFDFHGECPSGYVDMKDIKGQYSAKRAMEIAAAGGHNILMIGVPGSGKTLLARSLPTILPPMTREEALECTCLYSLAGELGGDYLVKQRPFRAPHHTSSSVSLIGGGTYPKPGEISMAYHGVLFLDEMVEFPKNVLQVLRQPLEDKVVHISRASGSFVFPADFQLVGACNPCPCGYRGDPEKDCHCSESQVQRYQSRLSGPLLDRIDLHVEVNRVTFSELHRMGEEESSQVVRERVIAARNIQKERYQGLGFRTNADLERRYLDIYCGLDQESSVVLERVFQKLHLSARAHDRILKVARTIADLEGAAEIHSGHILEAVQYRSLDRA